MHKLKPRFISIEGGDGTGKSTLANSLAQALRQRGLNVQQTREPGGSPGAEKIRELLLHSNMTWSVKTEALLFCAARSDHLQHTIMPALKRGEWLVCDRFSDSMLAYQAQAGELLHQLQKYTPLQPDITFLLDMPTGPELHKRRKNRNNDAFEQKSDAFHQNVRQNFLALAKDDPKRIIILNARNSPENLQNQALNQLAQRLGLPE